MTLSIIYALSFGRRNDVKDLAVGLINLVSINRKSSGCEYEIRWTMVKKELQKPDLTTLKHKEETCIEVE